MASAQMDSVSYILSEYDLNVDFNSVDVNLRCSLCKKLLNDAVVSTSCGCSYCSKCINDYLNEETKFCPGEKEFCKDEPLIFGNNIFKNASLNKRILKVKVKCPNQSCHFYIELSEMCDHLRLCIKQPMACPFVTIGCTSDTIIKEEVVAHLHSYVFSHSELLIELMDNLKNEVNVLREALKESKFENGALKEDLFKVKNEMEMRLNEESESRKEEINELKQSIERLITAAGNSKIKIDSLKSELEKKEEDTCDPSMDLADLSIGMMHVEVDEMRHNPKLVTENISGDEQGPNTPNMCANPSEPQIMLSSQPQEYVTTDMYNDGRVSSEFRKPMKAYRIGKRTECQSFREAVDIATEDSFGSLSTKNCHVQAVEKHTATKKKESLTHDFTAAPDAEIKPRGMQYVPPHLRKKNLQKKNRINTSNEEDLRESPTHDLITAPDAKVKSQRVKYVPPHLRKEH